MAKAKLFLSSLFLSSLAGACLLAPAAAIGAPVPDSAVTHHAMRIGGKTLAYDAEVGRVPIRDAETGEIHGQMGFIAYRVPTTGAPRPVTFVWNGGPGANSATLHFEMVGPKRGEGSKLVDNQETWLADTDLVFVDPIGTGFSRTTKAEYRKEFYGTVGDVASVTEFVRAWRLLEGRETAPIYLAGESWGAGRAGSVGYSLIKRGVLVKGLVLISGGSGLKAERRNPANLTAALKMVDLAATALHHHRLSPSVGSDRTAVQAKAEAWARETYAPALARIDQLSDADRDRIAGELAGYTGLKPEQIDRKTLVITPRQYREGLLKPDGKPLNIFDMRLTQNPREDFDKAVPTYLRQDLGYHTDLSYVGNERLEDGYAPAGKMGGGPGADWNYATAEATPEAIAAAIKVAQTTGGGPPMIGPPLPLTAEAVGLDASLKVMVVAGRYDSLNSCADNDETARQLPTPLKAAFSFKCYDGGHMFYRDQPSRLAFSRDFRALLQGARP
jgi:carboxypeptidase C (cathepsin A)